MSNLNKRQSELYQIIKNHGSMDVRSLISMFDVSAATIRKDLALLEQSQLIFRTHGEVHLAAQNRHMLPLEIRSNLRADAKKAIARAAAKEIHEGDSIILDSGSTTLEIAKLVKDYSHLTVITNSLPIALELSDSSVQVTIVGGLFLGKNLSIQGPEAEKYLSRIEVDKAFIGASGIRKDIGLATSNSLEGCIKHVMIEAARKTYAVLDSVKFDTSSVELFADFSEIDCIITEKTLQNPLQKERIGQLGIQVIVADQ